MATKCEITDEEQYFNSHRSCILSILIAVGNCCQIDKIPMQHLLVSDNTQPTW